MNNDGKSGIDGLAAAIAKDYRWPKKGDRLLRADDDWRSAVTFEAHEVSRHAHIWAGYLKAGDVLLEQCERTNSRLDRHELVYPVLFCYRHGLELAIKWIIARYGRFAGVSREDHAHHDLWQLWTVCKQIIIEVGSDGDIEGLEAVEQVVKDFHELDRGSFSFRYSHDKKGMMIVLPDVTFDLANTKDVMEGVNNLFIGADGQLDANSENIDCY